TMRLTFYRTLDQGLIWSQESSLDVHTCGSDSDETDDEVGEVYKVLLELKLEYQDLTERVEKSLKRIEEGRKCVTAFIDYHRDIVSHTRTVRGLIEQTKSTSDSETILCNGGSEITLRWTSL
ncbi:hypothetical protein PROFUN_15187, partial [Planoprotostelium fungivorum]